MGYGLTLATTIITVVGTVVGTVLAALIAAYFQYCFRRRKKNNERIPDESQEAFTSILPPVDIGRTTMQLVSVEATSQLSVVDAMGTTSHLHPVDVERITSQLPLVDVKRISALQLPPVDVEGTTSRLSQVGTSSQSPPVDFVGTSSDTIGVGRTQLLTVGPWGQPKDENSFHHLGFDGIKTIKIYSGSVIDSMEVLYTKDGKLFTHREGGRGGFEQPEVFLDDGEYINEVIGYFGSYRGMKTINFLTFFTNRSNKFGPYGKSVEEHNELETSCFNVKGGKIVGFHGNARKYINTIGFYVLPVMDLSSVSNRHANSEMKEAIGRPQLITMGPWGHPNVGNCFHHDCFDGIKTIKIYCGSVIDSMEVLYTKDGKLLTWTLKEGGYGGDARPKVVLSDGEYITEVIGYYGSYQGNKAINSLLFITNKSKTFGPYGKSVEEDGEIKTTRFHVRGGRIVGFHGNARKYISAIGFYVLPLDCIV